MFLPSLFYKLKLNVTVVHSRYFLHWQLSAQKKWVKNKPEEKTEGHFEDLDTEGMKI